MKCSNKMSHMSANWNLKKHRKMTFDDFDFLSPKSNLISFLSIGNVYFSFVLLLFSTFYNLLERLHNISRMNFHKTEPINCTFLSCILQGFPRHMADIFWKSSERPLSESGSRISH